MGKRLSIKTLLVLIFFLLASGYAYSKTKDLIAGPEIVISEPVNGATLEEQAVLVRGEARRIKRLTLNGREIITDENGYFAEEILLNYGYNLISLEASGKFGGQVKKQLELVFK